MHDTGIYIQHSHPFGMMIEARSWQAGGGYRYGFNGQEGDTEVSGNGNSYTAEFWQYDSRLGRRWNVDPLAGNFSGLSPYSVFKNNPITFIDPLGLSPKEHQEGLPEKPDRNAVKFDRKFNRWKERNIGSFPSGTPRIEIYESFKKSKTLFGKQRGEKSWFKKYENNTGISDVTGWDVSTEVPSNEIRGDAGLGEGRLENTVDLGTSSGTMTIDYNMFGKADRMKIVNSKSGDIIFDTKTNKHSNKHGEVKYKQGSGQVIDFNLGEGNTRITVLINEGRASHRKGDSVFRYKITLSNGRYSVQKVKNVNYD